MFRLYRELDKGEFIICWGDTSQGGADSNFLPFISKTHVDVPLVMQKQGTIASALPHIVQALEYIYRKTGVPPVICLERNNGGASAMYTLVTQNTEGHWTIYYMRTQNGEITDKPGWDTVEWSRAKMIGEWEVAYNNKQLQIYDEEILKQHKKFITNKKGKPEAAPNAHDDGVMSMAGGWQLFKTVNPPSNKVKARPRAKRAKFHV